MNKNITTRTIIIIIFQTLFWVSLLCAKDNVTYEKDILPIMKAKCYSCHGSDSPTQLDWRKDMKKYTDDDIGSRMDSYELLMHFIVGGDMGALTRRLDDGENTEDGTPGVMYKYLGSSKKARDENLTTFKKWIGYWSLESADSIKEKAELDWLDSMLSDEAPVEVDVDAKVKEIRDKIKAPKN